MKVTSLGGKPEAIILSKHCHSNNLPAIAMQCKPIDHCIPGDQDTFLKGILLKIEIAISNIHTLGTCQPLKSPHVHPTGYPYVLYNRAPTSQTSESPSSHKLRRVERTLSGFTPDVCSQPIH
jgi:hypothetical protein